MGGWAYFEFAYICCRNFCLKTAYFRGWNKNMIYFKFLPLRVDFGFRESILPLGVNFNCESYLSASESHF